MAIILIASKKGGVGKSTLCVNLSTYLAIEQGKDIIMVDSDNQALISEWSEVRSINESLKEIHCVRKLGHTEKTLLDFKGKYDHVIVDCAGRDTIEMRSAMVVADILIIPIRPSYVDTLTLKPMSYRLKQCFPFNKTLIPYCVMNIVPTDGAYPEMDNAVKEVANYQELTLISSIIHDRKVYRDAMIEGKGVNEMECVEAELAAEEIRNLVFELDHKILGIDVNFPGMPILTQALQNHQALWTP